MAGGLHYFCQLEFLEFHNIDDDSYSAFLAADEEDQDFGDNHDEIDDEELGYLLSLEDDKDFGNRYDESDRYYTDDYDEQEADEYWDYCQYFSNSDDNHDEDGNNHEDYEYDSL